MTYPLPRNTGKTNIGDRLAAINWLIEQKVAFSPIVYESYAAHPWHKDELMFVHFMAPESDPGVAEPVALELRNVAVWSVCMSSISIEAGTDGQGRRFQRPEVYRRRDYAAWVLPALARNEPRLIEAAESQAAQASLVESSPTVIWLGYRRGQLVAFVRREYSPDPVSDCAPILYKTYRDGKEVQ